MRTSDISEIPYMSHAIQLDLFDNYDFQDEEIRVINQTVQNVRKGLFKRHNDLAKMYMEILDKQEKIENRLYMMEQALNIKKFDGELSL